MRREERQETDGRTARQMERFRETDTHTYTHTDVDIQKEREKCGAVLARTSVAFVKRE